jgi:uncharacterized protein
MRLPLTLLAWLAVTPAARAVPDRSVPDRRPQAAVVDLTGTLTTGDLDAINAAARRATAGGELYVAVIDTTDGLASRAYATALFNRLGLDDRIRNRGVLLLAALDDRKAEIILGDGFSHPVTSVTDDIMRDVVVARFKLQDPRGALVEGAQALADRVLLASPSTSPPAPAPAPSDGTAAIHPEPSETGLWKQAKDMADAAPLALWGGLGALCVGALIGTLRYLRHRPRACTQCGQQMVRLDESQDDAHLTSGQRTEESLHSVDYDVWMCQRCHHVLKLRYGALITRYARCPACNARTVSTHKTTLEYATEYSTGLVRVDEQCQHCSYHRSDTRIVPRISRSSSSSSSGSGSSSGRGSSGGW